MQNTFQGIKYTRRDNNAQRRPSANYFQIETVVNAIRNTIKKDFIIPKLLCWLSFYSVLTLRNEIKRKMISL